ncbi:MAG: peptidoglycan-N-acetylglucosamine deacetylase, partial [Solirubrobacteraceae bacterium]|nr:peptidoglycan-N-acetylglucosamine deacetylase [Solirubrobacteraceae bacterium]
HPYDFDTDEPFDVLPEASVLPSRILHARRGGAFERVARVLDAGGGPGAPLAERAAALEGAALPVVDHHGTAA